MARGDSYEQLKLKLEQARQEQEQRERSKRRWQQLTRWLTTPRVAGLLLGALGVLIAVAGIIYHHCPCHTLPNLVAGWEQEFEDFYANVSASLVTIAIAVFTIDWLNERRAERELKAQFIREMGSKDNGIALRAVRELRGRGWLEDGSLKGADFDNHTLMGPGADLQGAFLNGARLQEVSLVDANLHEADLVDANLDGAYLTHANLQGTLMWGIRLRAAKLMGANLQGAEVWAADLRESDVWDANLRGVDLSLTNLQGALHLTDRQLVTVFGLWQATMPHGSQYDGRFNLGADIKRAIKDIVIGNWFVPCWTDLPWSGMLLGIG